MLVFAFIITSNPANIANTNLVRILLEIGKLGLNFQTEI